MNLLTSLSDTQLFNIVKKCASLPLVKQEVLKNHDNNLWWPLYVTDWRIRMIVAGWSTRVGYSMIKVYQKVVKNIHEIGYDELVKMKDEEVIKIIASLGLSQSRLDYLRSLTMFLDTLGINHIDELNLSHEDFISKFANNVKGAGYKVAQCALLYAKGYHCGIFPIDSGMKDLLGSCIGLNLPSGAIAHEIMRKYVEESINRNEEKYKNLIKDLGYETLNIPQDTTPIWFIHLSLIYFKRAYCNKGKPHQCPIRISLNDKNYIGQMCNKTEPQKGGIKFIVLEGIDKVGKSFIADKLEKNGYLVQHCNYNPNHTDIHSYYEDIIKNAERPIVFDRFFLSELVYGQILRGGTRINKFEQQNLLKLMAEKGFIILHLKDDSQTLQNRLNDKEHSKVLENFTELINEYEKVMTEAKTFVKVLTVNTKELKPKTIIQDLSQILKDYEISRNR